MGALAAHTAAGTHGFRQKEVRFFAELFSNWIQPGGVGAVLAIHNTQILRYVSFLQQDLQARSITKGKSPRYRLTRVGIFTMISKLTNRSYLSDRSQALLVWYFLTSYAPQLRQNAASSSAEFSKAHKIELESILNPDSFLRRQISIVDQEILRLKERVEGAIAMSDSVKRLMSRGANLAQCIAHVGHDYPYELNSHRSFQELLTELPEAVLTWELCEGASLKAQAIFEPIYSELLAHRAVLEKLLGQAQTR